MENFCLYLINKILLKCLNLHCVLYSGECARHDRFTDDEDDLHEGRERNLDDEQRVCHRRARRVCEGDLRPNVRLDRRQDQRSHLPSQRGPVPLPQIHRSPRYLRI